MTRKQANEKRKSASPVAKKETSSRFTIVKNDTPSGRPPKRLASIQRKTISRPLGPLFDAVMARATEVIGDKQEAMRWMGTPVRALSYATPISILADPGGKAAVLTVLTQLEHGVL